MFDKKNNTLRVQLESNPLYHTIDDNDGDYVCARCAMTWGSKSYGKRVTVAEAVMGGKPLTCDSCGRKYT